MTHVIKLAKSLNAGDMVRITPGDSEDGVWAQVEVGSTEAEKPASWIPAAPNSVAMYLGDELEESSPEAPLAQILHEGRILNIMKKYLRPES